MRSGLDFQFVSPYCMSQFLKTEDPSTDSVLQIFSAKKMVAILISLKIEKRVITAD